MLDKKINGLPSPATLAIGIAYAAKMGVVASKVQKALDDLFADLSLKSGANLGLLFSLAHDFPSEWSAFVNGAGNLSVTVQRDYFPYFTQGLDLALLDFHLYAEDHCCPAKSFSQRISNSESAEYGQS